MSVPFCVIEFENAARGDARAARSRRRHRPRLRVLQQVMRMGSTAAQPPATLARATQRPLDDRLARRPCAPSTRRRLRSLPRRFRLGGAVRLDHMGFGCQEAGSFRFTAPTRQSPPCSPWTAARAAPRACGSAALQSEAFLQLWDRGSSVLYCTTQDASCQEGMTSRATWGDEPGKYLRARKSPL